MADAGAGEEEVVGAEAAVPEGEVGPEGLDEAGEGAGREAGREGDVEEVGLVGVVGDELGVEEGGVEQGFGRGGEGEGRRWGVDVDFESGEHAVVVGEEDGGGGEVRGVLEGFGVDGGGGEEREEEEEEREGRGSSHFWTK